MKRSQLDRFLILRNNVFTFKKRVPGRVSPLQISLETSDRELARAKRDQLLKDLAEKELTEIRGPRGKRTTVGELLDLYEQGIGTATRIEPRTVTKCVNDTLNFIRWALPERTDEPAQRAVLVTTLLDLATVRAFKQNYLRVAGSDRQALESRRRGAEALLRNVRAVFSRHARPLYASVHLPKLTEFLAEAQVTADARKHVAIGPDTLKALDAAIATQDKSLWLVHALHKFAGVRNEEICELRPEWFVRAPWGQVFIGVVRRPYFEPKRSEGFVPIAAEVAALFAPFVADLQPMDHVVLPQATACARAELVNREHARFMRRFLPKGDFAKAGYELRRWAAQVFELRHGKDAAENFLRHQRAGVAAAHYLEEWARWRRLGSDLGITLADARGESTVEVLGTWQQGAAALAGTGNPPAAAKKASV